MLDLNKCTELVEAFTPGIGDEPERDNLAGGLVDDLKYAKDSCLMAYCYDDAKFIDKRTLTAIISTLTWFEDCIKELNQKHD